MPLWSMNDNANGIPISLPAQLNQTPNTANRNATYGNTTADAYFTGQTIGAYAVDETEIAVGAIYATAVAPNNHGSGGSYIPGDSITANAAGATFSDATKFSVATTRVRTVTITAGHLGAGYANNDTVTVNSGIMTTNAVFTVTTGASNTSIASLALTTNGVFTTNPTNLANCDLKNVTVANSSANGAQATITMGVDTLTITDPGTYTVIPTNITSMIGADGANGSGTGLTMAVTFGGKKSKGVTHTGWVKRTVGSGNRAGRVHYEVLVAGGPTSDGEDVIFPDA